MIFFVNVVDYSGRSYFGRRIDLIINLLEVGVGEVLQFLIITTISSSLGTLKNMLIARKQIKASYIVSFLDALLFATIMKQISSGDGFIFALAYATGKLLGAMLGNLIEKKMALGTLEVEIAVNHFDRMVCIADKLRDLGYSVETSAVFGYEGKKRYKIVVILLRKEMCILNKVLEENGYEEPTMIIRDVSSISGKISIRSEK